MECVGRQKVTKNAETTGDRLVSARVLYVLSSFSVILRGFCWFCALLTGTSGDLAALMATVERVKERAEKVFLVLCSFWVCCSGLEFVSLLGFRIGAVFRVYNLCHCLGLEFVLLSGFRLGFELTLGIRIVHSPDEKQQTSVSSRNCNDESRKWRRKSRKTSSAKRTRKSLP